MTKANPVLILALAQVVAPLNDPRESRNPAHIARMAAHLRSGGRLPPIYVIKREDGKFEVLTGETRRLAHVQAGFTEIEAIVREDALSEAELLLERYRENAWREDFNPIERAAIYVALMKQNGWSQAELAEAVGEKPPFVNRVLQINKRLIVELQALVAAMELHPSHAYLLSQIPPEHQASLGPRVVKENWKRDRLEREVKRMLGKRVRKAKPVKVELPNGCTLLIPGDLDDHEAVEEDLKHAISLNRKGKKIAESEAPPLLLPAG